MSAAALVLAAAASLINAPDDWRKESFDFPLRFAPGIPYEGTEQVRFHPAWTKFGEEGGFSYVVLWDVKAAPVEPPDIEDHLETYFNGLMSNVARGREVELPATRSTVAAHPMAPLAGWPQAFGVEIRTFNAFSKGEPLLLHGEVTQRSCPPGRMQILFVLSPSRRDRPIWNGLRAVRSATTCEAPRS
jgi:hypothetical protein